MNSLEVKQIHKNFKEHAVLNDISFSVEEGEIFGLLGPSGAGKTTLIKILTGQLKADSGSAKLLGESCATLSPASYSKIGMLLDTSGLYERLSCYDNLLLFCRIYNVPKEIIYEVLEKVGISKAIKTPAGKLSKGMKSRLALGRALLHSPKVLFLDEPTSGLDPATTKMIHELLISLQKQGTTIFLTTHQMDEATKLCHHIALLNEGKIIEYGAPDALCLKYNADNTITIRLKDGTYIYLANNKDNAPQIAAYFQSECLESIHSSEPSLEQVFINLTGRGLD